MQRYGLRIIDRRAVIATDDSGWYYLADDVDDALRQAEQRGLSRRPTCQYDYDRGYEQGQRDGYKEGYGAAMDDGWGEDGTIEAALDAAAQRVANLIAYDITKDGHLILRGEAEAAIKGDSNV